MEVSLLGGTSHGNKGGRRRPSLPPPPLQRPTLLLFPLPSRSLERKICITQFFRQFFSSPSPLFFFSRGPFSIFFLGRGVLGLPFFSSVFAEQSDRAREKGPTKREKFRSEEEKMVIQFSPNRVDLLSSSLPDDSTQFTPERAFPFFHE